MPRIMTTCSQTGGSVPTGHRSNDPLLGAFTGGHAFRCPVCAQVHAWTRDEASLETALSMAEFRLGATG
jgi:hypothetical protein